MKSFGPIAPSVMTGARTWKPSSIPGTTLYIKPHEDERKPIGTPINLREYVQKLELQTHPDPVSYVEPTDQDTQSLARIKREVVEVLAFPRLRQVQIDIWIDRGCDAYLEGMTDVKAIVGLCNELRDRIRAGLKVRLCRAWPCDFDKFEFLEYVDISWMWGSMSREDREVVVEDRAAWKQYIRVLIKDGVGAEAEFSLLEELRLAGGMLLKGKDEIWEMEKWELWMGTDEDTSKEIKENWRKEEEPALQVVF